MSASIQQQRDVPNPVLNLDEKSDLFRDENAYAQFVRWMQDQLDRDFRPLVADGEVIGATLSIAGTKTVLSERLEQRWRRNPELLDALTERIETMTDEDIVE